MGVTLSKLYTRTGDDGTTALVDGKRVPKSDLRVEAFGTADELNAWIGVLRTRAGGAASPLLREKSEIWFHEIQNHLFDLGSAVATSPAAGPLVHFDDEAPKRMEGEIDFLTARIPPLRNFVLPGGSELNAWAHVARTVCRRLERLLVRLHQAEPVDEAMRRYVNRLSDFLFAYSRWAAKEEGTPEYLWGQKAPVAEGGKSGEEKR
ncbi:MAG: cob(I)yrinic acid a,c-diamide adenosyltransferase [Spirochaetes bacterium]|nr:cob(I)yrinic acid a,c-diamide adenosyltransferase [Spirochaetota bacterium]